MLPTKTDFDGGLVENVDILLVSTRQRPDIKVLSKCCLVCEGKKRLRRRKAELN